MTAFRWGNLQKIAFSDLLASENDIRAHWFSSAAFVSALGKTLRLPWQPLSVVTETSSTQLSLTFIDDFLGRDVYILTQIGDSQENALSRLFAKAQGKTQATLILVKSELTDLDVSQIAWLNQITVADVNCYGVELNFFCVDTTTFVLPVVTSIIENQNHIQKFEILSPELDSTPLLHQTNTREVLPFVEFWLALNCELLRRKCRLVGQKPVQQNWLSFALTDTYHLIASLDTSSKSCVVGLVIKADKDGRQFKQIQLLKPSIELELNVNAKWEFNAQRQVARIYVRHIGCDITQRDTWPEIIGILVDLLEKFQSVFELQIQPSILSKQFSSEPEVDVPLHSNWNNTTH